jgi:hypothetical protein
MKSWRGRPLVKPHQHFHIWHGGILLSYPDFWIGFFSDKFSSKRSNFLIFES